jgi:hypothetical protein
LLYNIFYPNPALTGQENNQMQRVIDAFEAHIDQLIATSVEQILAARHPFYSRLPAAALQKAVDGAFQAVLRDLKNGTNRIYDRRQPAARPAGRDPERCHQRI